MIRHVAGMPVYFPDVVPAGDEPPKWRDRSKKGNILDNTKEIKDTLTWEERIALERRWQTS